jgi:anti-sigma factor RsiW
VRLRHSREVSQPVAGSRETMGPLAHHRMKRAVAAYLDGELDAADAVAVAMHLRECWRCSGEAEALRMIKRSLRRRSGDDVLAVLRLRRFAAGRTS